MIFQTPFFKLFSLALALYGLCYILFKPSDDIALDLHLKNQFDLAIVGHTNQILRHLVHHKVISPRATREAAQKLQARLACSINNGTWTTKGRKHVHYRHDPNCFENWPSLEDLDLPQVTSLLCNRIHGKRLLLVGSRAFYHAQALLLQALALHDNRSYPNRSPESGSHYFVCGNLSPDNKLGPSWTLPFNPRNLSHQSLPVGFARLSFSLADTLSPLRDAQHRMVAQPVVDPRTGIRTYISDWLADSQKAQVLILNKGPLPAPASTFDGYTGNWSFATTIPQEAYARLRVNNLTLVVVNAAMHVVFQEYVPDLLQALNALSLTGKSQRLFIGPWHQHPTCTNAGLGSNFRTASLIWENNVKFRQVDPWTLYYNAQVYIIDQILPAILPYYDIIYVPMTLPLTPEHLAFTGLEHEGRQKDCLRLPADHPAGRTLQLALVKIIVYFLRS